MACGLFCGGTTKSTLFCKKFFAVGTNSARGGLWIAETSPGGIPLKPLSPRARSEGLFMMTSSRRASVLTTPGPFFSERLNLLIC